ncbi:DUF6230 family protein [Catenuloplanes atrovinosus]|uniref:Cholesterol esterase n=1 Tax=Catenuloplanes atrovinosus TaxID=137266 RepID=A0AAE3YX67_9ACTN|nr:DUF6230 family protein [Catenuloplanes atrovinosus]MDR7279864.1 hypothetical protein [Catenuloplanes atrovinosus]
MQERQAKGHVRWRRAAILGVPTVIATGFMVFGMSNGAIAASFSVSGSTFKVAADRLEGDGFAQYGGIATEQGGERHPTAVSAIREAELYNLCQSVNASNPLVGRVILTINAGGGDNPATASNLVLDVDELEGDATFTNIEIGRDASTLNKGGDGAKGQPGLFGQQADHVTINNLRQVAWTTTAGTFALTGLRLKVNVGDDAKECF